MRSLYVKFAFTTIAIMLVSSLFSFFISNSYYQHKLKPENDEKNTEIALTIAQYIESEKSLNIDLYLNNIAKIGYQMLLLDASGTELFYGDPFREKDLSLKVKDSVINGSIYHGIAEYPKETFVTGFFANDIANTIGVPLQHEGQTYALFIRPNIKLLFNEMHHLFGWLIGLTILLSILFVLIGTKYLVHPIIKLTSATKDISEGNFSVKLDIEREDEIGELAKSFTQMGSKLEKLDEMRNEFISNISHDLQSPLSNIKGYAELLASSSAKKEEKEQYFSIIRDETKRLSTLTKQLLLLASLDRNEDLLKKATYSLSEQLKEVIFNRQWLINEKGIMISYSFPDDVTINGDAALLYNVWDNVITNAIKYNQENGSIYITVTKDNEYVEICFQDKGIGLSEKAQERLFERFYREDSARSKSVEGTGLGLSIVASIVKLHDGFVKVESKKNEGTTFRVFLPHVTASSSSVHNE